jgi:hypothetical protein
MRWYMLNQRCAKRLPHRSMVRRWRFRRVRTQMREGNVVVKNIVRVGCEEDLRLRGWDICWSAVVVPWCGRYSAL